MIYPDDAKQFSIMMDVTWQSNHRNPVDKQTKRYWFDKLQHLPMGDLEIAFDYWIMHNKEKLPTIPEIIDLCKPKPQFNKALPKPKNDEVSQAGVEKINKVIAENIKPKIDHKKWARQILDNPSKCADIAVRHAKEALRAV
jgi:hypothetical protein